MKVIQIKGTVPAHARGTKGPIVAKCKEIIESEVQAHEGTVTMFRVSKGTVTVGVENDAAYSAVVALYKDKDGVSVETMSAVDALLADVRAAEEAEKKRKGKKNNGGSGKE